MHTIMSHTAFNTDAGRQPLTSILINTPPHINPADPFVEPPRIHFTENMPVAQSPVLQRDDEDEDLVVLTIPVAGNAQTPIRTDAALKRIWNATKGVFKNKKTPVCYDDDDASFVIVFQTPDRPTRLTCAPSVQREMKMAEIHDTESVLDIVRPTTNCSTWLTGLPPAQREAKDDNVHDETRKEYAAWIQKRNAAGNVCRTPGRPNTLTSPPLVRRVTRKVELGDAVAVEEMTKAARVTVKRLQTVC